MTESKRQASALVSSFWDASAIVPLCCHQNTTAKAKHLARTYGRHVVWWATPVEIISALHRLIRGRYLSQAESAQAHARLVYLRNRWSEIQPSEKIRAQAEQLLRMHSLRTGDALQLSAALVWCNNYPREHVFIAADRLLLEAAQIEGFTVCSI